MPTEIQQAFDGLIASIQSLVFECKTKQPNLLSIRLIQKTTVMDVEKTDTGIVVRRSTHEIVQREDWYRAVFYIQETIKKMPEYNNFRDKTPASINRNKDSEVARMVQIITNKIFEGKPINSHELLDYFLKFLNNTSIPAWVDIDVYGISIKGTQSIDFQVGNRRFVLRQLVASDFEEEEVAGVPHHSPRFGIIPPRSILKIEVEASAPIALQAEAIRAKVVLRLFQVCSVQFSRESWHSVSPFAPFFGSGGPIEKPLSINHDLTLYADSSKILKSFWESVEPKLPSELREFSAQKSTTISIAFERYSDGLMTGHPIERKIAYAIMGLEAIYLKENEIQELMYRLELRVSKVVTKLGIKYQEVRSRLKDGYKIRNSYVHGGHLSEKERKKIEDKGISVNDLAVELLDYLRISILHLMISNQTKEQFLDLIEMALIERDQDEVLHKMLTSEESILRPLVLKIVK